jgi:2-polyprenyl-3-methyl-5-hydroxy-6-metoxy-1,4-benzoquinol methylase
MGKSIKGMLCDRINRQRIYPSVDYWNEKARLYEGSAVSMFANRRLNEIYEHDQLRFIDGALGQVAGRHVLDVGCGTGRLSRHLASRGATVTAFDFAPAAIDIARRLNGMLPISLSVRSVFEVNEVDAYDDIVVLGCLTIACRSREDFQDVLARLYRAIRPAGRLVMLEPFHRGFLHRVLRISGDEAAEDLRMAGFVVTGRAALHFGRSDLSSQRSNGLA